MPGTQLVREIVRRSPKTACMIMTAGLPKPADLPEGVPVIGKPFDIQDLASAIQSCLAQSAEAIANLRRDRMVSAQLHEKSKQLREETTEAVRQASEILKRCCEGDQSAKK